MRVQIAPAVLINGPHESLRRPSATVIAPPSNPTLTLRRACLHALWNLLLMIRNVTLSAFVAMSAAALTSRGNVLSSTPPERQWRATFLVASLLTTHLLGSSFTLVVIASRLMTKRFVARDAKRHGVVFSVVRTMRFALVHLVISTVAVAAMGVGCASLPPRVRPFKLEYYLHAIIGQYFSSACDAHVRHVLQHETIEGRERETARRELSRLQSLARLRAISAPCAVPIARWLQSFRQSLPLLGSMMVAGLYIHVVNQWTFDAGMAANLFVLASLAFKLGMQELAKHYIRTHGVTSLQHMCMVVGVPTVLIETQARVVILGLQNAQSTLLNTYSMAVAEVIVRLAKLWWLRRTLRRLQTLERRQQAMGLHTAETLADMYAEYIAIVCSAAIGVFWSTSPQYTVTSAAHEDRSLGLTLSVQLGVELLVDYVASVVELLGGVELDHTRGFGVFLASLFLMLTVVNMNMSAVLYLRNG